MVVSLAFIVCPPAVLLWAFEGLHFLANPASAAVADNVPAFRRHGVRCVPRKVVVGLTGNIADCGLLWTVAGTEKSFSSS